MDAATGEAPAPFEVIEAGLCDRLHKLPEELDRADWRRLLIGFDALEIFSVFKKRATGQKLDRDEMRLVGEMAQLSLDRPQPASMPQHAFPVPTVKPDEG